jgi:hypothetical protein
MPKYQLIVENRDKNFKKLTQEADIDGAHAEDY